jgi:ribonucleoside-triphosphate reductase
MHNLTRKTTMTKMNDYQKYIAMSRYARFLPKEERRETWEETVARYCDFWKQKNKDFPYGDVFAAIRDLEVMPSMRALMTAGKALDRDNAAGYNCAYLAVDDIRAFDECLYLLMCGVGVGFSVERQCIAKLPVVAEEFQKSSTVIHVRDSKIGWATAYRELISLLYAGQIPDWNTDALRAAGAPLKTFGGRSSGPAPFEELLQHTVRIFRNAAGRRLTSIECHDIMNHIGSAVVVGGVRRSAQISLSNLSDDRMRAAKSGQWWVDNAQRALANNSVVYTEKPDIGIFMDEWKSLYASRSGERGVFNRQGAISKMKKAGRRDWKKYEEWFGGCNPCAEIFLRSQGFCNLTEVVIRAGDTLQQIKDKIVLATILGTYQSSLTNFRYLRSAWKKNAEEERLLGVSLTGIMDHEVLSFATAQTKQWLQEMRQVAIDTNALWAQNLGINASVAITTCKPSGTVSQLVDSASGIHARYSPYYIRTVRSDKTDPIGIFLKEQGVPCEDDVTKPDKTWVFSFPMASPPHARIASEMTALEQLEHYKMFYENWAEHTVSITVYVRENEWLEVGAWVYKNFDDVGGISFLPYSDHSYRQAPYQPITLEEYELALSKYPKVDWSKFNVNEHADNTVGSQTLACAGGSCEIN